MELLRLCMHSTHTQPNRAQHNARPTEASMSEHEMAMCECMFRPRRCEWRAWCDMCRALHLLFCLRRRIVSECECESFLFTCDARVCADASHRMCREMAWRVWCAFFSTPAHTLYFVGWFSVLFDYIFLFFFAFHCCRRHRRRRYASAIRSRICLCILYLQPGGIGRSQASTLTYMPCARRFFVIVIGIVNGAHQKLSLYISTYK